MIELTPQQQEIERLADLAETEMLTKYLADSRGVDKSVIEREMKATLKADL